MRVQSPQIQGNRHFCQDFGTVHNTHAIFLIKRWGDALLLQFNLIDRFINLNIILLIVEGVVTMTHHHCMN